MRVVCFGSGKHDWMKETCTRNKSKKGKISALVTIMGRQAFKGKEDENVLTQNHET